MGIGVKIVITAFCAVVILAVLKKDGKEFTMPVILVSGGCIVYCTLDAMARISSAVVGFVRISQIELWVVESVVKVVGLSLLTKVASEVCKGAGETGLASIVDTAGTILALACTLPLAQAVVDMVVEMLA